MFMKNIQAFWFPSIVLFIIKYNFLFLLIYSILILYFIFYIYNNKYKKNKINYIEYISFIKDKEFILFKSYLFNLYYSSIILLLVYLFKNNYLLNLNLILFLIILSATLLNNGFIILLFNVYKIIQNNIKLLDEINFNSPVIFNFNRNIYNKFYRQTRSFSTDSKFNAIDDSESKGDYVEFLDITKTENSNKTHNKKLAKFKKIFGGGYLGYRNVHHFGTVFYDFNSRLPYSIDGLENKIIHYLNQIPDNVVYSVLPIIRWQNSIGNYQTLTISKSIKITNDTNKELIAEKFERDLNEALLIYELANTDLDFYVMSRPWLKRDAFDIDRADLTSVFNEQLEKEISSWLKDTDKEKGINTKVRSLKDYPYKNIIMNQYGDPVTDKNKTLIGYKLNETECASIKTYYNDDNLLCNKVSIKEFDKIKQSFKNEFDELTSWVDIKTCSGFIREYNKKIYTYDKNNNLINVEVKFNCVKFPPYKKDNNLNHKIGTIDFETYGLNLGLGYHQVYAGGWAIKNSTKLFYIKKKESSEQFVNRVFSNIFMDPDLKGYTFYAHNLGRFDSIFILKSLITNKNINIVPVWKDNTIISLNLNINDFKITLLDSLQLIPGSLESILNSFKCFNKKGVFPYSFVNEKNLYYIGDKPSKDYYINIKLSEYSNIPNNNWDLKKETLNYLKSDVEGLLEALTKFSENIYNKYQLNITKFKTLPSLVMSVYGSSYLPENLKSELRVIKGGLEKELRTSYFGGNVDVFINKISKGFHYDMNSQYPKAMLNDMPLGEPRLSLETDLNKIFGFVYGEITCPNENILLVPFIQHRDTYKNKVSCPRGKFKRLIFSEEIKYALKYGYTIKIEYCYQFKRGKDLFKTYVDYHYETKSSTEDPLERFIAKLFLNTLYGRFGMKDIDDSLKIVSKSEAEALDKISNISVISELTEDKYFVKYSGQISDRIRKLYATDPLKLEKNKILTKDEFRDFGLIKNLRTPSAVHIAAAISSYARMIINEYKNIPGNPCIMSDTDSAVLIKPLAKNLVGNGLGQMKLENEISEGIFIKKKLYYIRNSSNQEIIKSSGIDSSHLNYKLFLNLLNGESVEVRRKSFNVDWKNLSLIVDDSNLVIQGLIGKVKTIYNVNDVNYKYISFPIKYNIIIHPSLNLEIKTVEIKEKITSSAVLQYSFLEILFLFLFITLFMSILGLLLYQIY